MSPRSRQQNPTTRTRVVARPVSLRTGVLPTPFSRAEHVLLIAGMAAIASLLTSCSSSRAASGGSDPVISSGLDALADPGTKQPKLNRSAEIKRDAEEHDAYAKLADQATLDLNALLEARGRRKETKSSEANTAGGTASDIAVRHGSAEDNGTQHTAAHASRNDASRQVPDEGTTEKPVKKPESATPGSAAGNTAETPAKPADAAKETVVDSSWADDPTRTIPSGERPRAESRFAKDAKPTTAADATRDAVTNREPKISPTAMTATPPPEPVPAVPVFKGVNAALCTRVTGFGKLEAMPIRKGRNAFVFPAARVNRAIVYVELENFGYRPAKSTDPDFTAGDAWAVELSTEIQLLDDPDSILQFKERERTVIETGRNKRRDFYLVQEIELPPTLTVGAYNLKLILRDKSGAEPVRSEIVLPVQIVADVTASVDER